MSDEKPPSEWALEKARKAIPDMLDEDGSWARDIAHVLDAARAEGAAGWEGERHTRADLAECEHGMEQQGCEIARLRIELARVTAERDMHAGERELVEADRDLHAKAGFEMSADLEMARNEVAALKAALREVVESFDSGMISHTGYKDGFFIAARKLLEVKP